MTSALDRDEELSRFFAQVSAVGGHFESVPDLDAARKHVTKLAIALDAKQIVVCDDALSSKLFPATTDEPFKVASQANLSREEFLRALEAAKIGVSSVDLAVAETGTLLIATSNESNRLVTALPEIHVALVPRSKLVASLQAAGPRISQILRETVGGVTVSLISASSRTSDIGDKVILGVHGPKALHVLLLGQELGGS